MYPRFLFTFYLFFFLTSFSVFIFPTSVSAVDAQDTFSVVSIYGKSALQKNIRGKIYTTFQNTTSEDLSGMVDIALIQNGKRVRLAEDRPFSVGDREKVKIFFIGEIPTCGEVSLEFSFRFDDARKSVDVLQGMATVSCASSAAVASFEDTISRLPIPDGVKNSVLDTTESIVKSVPDLPELPTFQTLKNTFSTPLESFGVQSLSEKTSEILPKKRDEKKVARGIPTTNTVNFSEKSPEKSIFTKLTDLFSSADTESLQAKAGGFTLSHALSTGFLADLGSFVSLVLVLGFFIFLIRGWKGVEDESGEEG
jgi:hypothetical protein